VNGNSFLTAFYKLSRIHEKILLGIPIIEDIGNIEVLKIGEPEGGSPSGSLSPSLSRSNSQFGKSRSTISRSTSKLNKLPKLMNPPGSKSRPATQFSTPTLEKKYSSIFNNPEPNSRPFSRETDDAEPFPFKLNTPRKNIIESSRYPSPMNSRPGSGSFARQNSSMLAQIFNGVNPWTASSEALQSFGISSPPKSVSPTVSPSRRR
jgi:hypothetical protein